MFIRIFIAAAALGLAASGVLAQQADMPAPAASGTSQARDCAPPRHDHGAERNVPTPQKPCKPAQGAGKARADKPLVGDDRVKMHKNQ